ncbi:hypothetical protein HK103_004675 [Boothiomyces macroporosus]|uniref:T4 RNA ligase 1-like N-terminal domain-containing protein n=1 Tax=Boothiomyces macroporosus TaxID=261099 RepID=A0AAD5UM80_9FUNG|nr:hypothetical protein HK103_004675 [Boothiomyces macroporosus]
MSLLQRLIQDWPFERVKTVLSAEPYSLKVKESTLHPSLYLLAYNMINSDLSHPIVQECRGIILEKETNRIICYPFDKFFNMGEKNEHPIDWKSALVYEKLDGSLMKLYYYDKEDQWIIASNNSIDAREAPVAIDQMQRAIHKVESFHYLFIQAYETTTKQEFNIPDILDRSMTYMFEMMHPLSTIVVQHEKPRLCHLATRKITGGFPEVEFVFPLVEQPTVYPLSSPEQCKQAAEQIQLNGKLVDTEGFVVRDKYFKRVKVKSPVYVSLHHLASTSPNQTTLMDAVLMNELEEIVTYHPRLEKPLRLLHEGFDKLEALFLKELKECDEYTQTLLDPPAKLLQKERALFLQKKSRFLFSHYMNYYRDKPSNRVEFFRESCKKSAEKTLQAVMNLISKEDQQYFTF